MKTALLVAALLMLSGGVFFYAGIDHADARCRTLVKEAVRQADLESGLVTEGRHRAGYCEFRFVTPWQSGGKL